MANVKKKTQKKYGYQKYRLDAERKKKITVALISLLGILIVALCFIDDNQPRTFAIKDVRICDGMIKDVYKEDDNTHYVQVMLTSNVPAEQIDSEELWIEVSSDFYSNHNQNDQVAVLVGKCDEFKEKLFTKGRTLKKSYWEIQSIFESMEEARQTYPENSFTAKAMLIKKKLLKNGSLYFVLNYDARSYVIKVDQKAFDRYSVNNEVECKFESLGDFVKLTRILI